MKNKSKTYIFYTEEGIRVKIKVDEGSEYISGRVILKIKNEKTGEKYFHSPDKKFKNIIDVVEFIIKNVETPNLKFKIL